VNGPGSYTALKIFMHHMAENNKKTLHWKQETAGRMLLSVWTCQRRLHCKLYTWKFAYEFSFISAFNFSMSVSLYGLETCSII